MNNISSEKIIIDGGNGFLGKSIFNHLEKGKSFKVIKLNRNYQFSAEIKGKYQLIIATGLFKGSILDLVKSNVLRPVEVLSRFSKYFSKIILLSSGAVYGSKFNDPPSLEEDNLKPYDLYSSSKIAIENLVKCYCENIGLPLTILRLPIIYSGDSLKGVLPEMILTYNRKKIINVYSSGKSVRDFLHIDDFLKATEKVLRYDIQGIYNISSGATYSMLDLAKIIVNDESEIIISEDNPNHLEKLSLDFCKARNDISFYPKFNSLDKKKLLSIYGINK